MADDAAILTDGEGSGGDQSQDGSEVSGNGGEDSVVDESSQSKAPKWMGQLPDDLKGNEDLSQFATIGELGKAFLDARGKAEQAIEIPGEDATEEQRAAYREKMGIPQSPEDYKFEELELPSEFKGQAEFDTWFAQKSHELGLTADQASRLRNEMLTLNSENTSAQQKAFEKSKADTEKQLREVYGDRYEENLELARKAVKSRNPEFADFLRESGLTNHPEMVRLMADIGQLYSEDRLPGGKPLGQKDRPVDPRNPDAWIFENTPGMDR